MTPTAWIGHYIFLQILFIPQFVILLCDDFFMRCESFYPLLSCHPSLVRKTASEIKIKAAQKLSEVLLPQKVRVQQLECAASLTPSWVLILL